MTEKDDFAGVFVERMKVEFARLGLVGKDRARAFRIGSAVQKMATEIIPLAWDETDPQPPIDEFRAVVRAAMWYATESLDAGIAERAKEESQ